MHRCISLPLLSIASSSPDTDLGVPSPTVVRSVGLVGLVGRVDGVVPGLGVGLGVGAGVLVGPAVGWVGLDGDGVDGVALVAVVVVVGVVVGVVGVVVGVVVGLGRSEVDRFGSESETPISEEVVSGLEEVSLAGMSGLVGVETSASEETEVTSSPVSEVTDEAPSGTTVDCLGTDSVAERERERVRRDES